MLYLLRSYGISGKSKPILKIGFSNSIKNRLDQYFYMNPGSEVVATREGDEIMESLFHFYFKFLGYQYKKNGKLDEWFLNYPEIYQIFHISQETLEKLVWKNREYIFDSSKLSSVKKSNLNYSIFEYLYKKNKETFVGEEFEFKGDNKIIRTKAKKVDIAFWSSWIKLNEREIKGNINNPISEIDSIIQDFLDNCFYSTGVFREKLRMYCEFMDSYQEDQKKLSEVSQILVHKIPDQRFKKLYDYFGTSGCRAQRFEEKPLMTRILGLTKESEYLGKILNRFKVGEKYLGKDIKEILQGFRDELGMTGKAKATDLGRYFKLIRTSIKSSETGGFETGFKLGFL